MSGARSRFHLRLAMLLVAVPTRCIAPHNTAASPPLVQPTNNAPQPTSKPETVSSVGAGEQDPRSRACPGINASETIAPGGACTLVGCFEQLTLTLTAAADIPPGTYRLVVGFDEQQLECHATLPLTKCTLFDCNPEPDGFDSDCYPGDSSVGLGGAWSSRFPRVVNFDMFGADRRIATARLEPEYSSFLPNGPGCGRGCCSGHGSAKLSRLR